jgi:hypothetical protein
MSFIELLPPPREACLETPYPSSQKGGTLIAAVVTDLDEHERCISDPDFYRPDLCRNCHHGVLHVHDYRDRTLRGQEDRAVARVLRYRCANLKCRATWQVLPQVIARCLHRSWPVVEAALKEERRTVHPSIPLQTMRRWEKRMRSSARQLVSAFAQHGGSRWASLVESVGLDASCEQLAAGYRLGLAALAALLHKWMPGVRLM